MKETFITQITEAMSGTLTVDQMTQLSSVLLQTLSSYTLIADGDKVQEDIISNNRLLEIFLSAKLVEGCSQKTIKYYETTIRQLFRYMPKAVKEYTTDESIPGSIPEKAQIQQGYHRQHTQDIFIILLLA